MNPRSCTPRNLIWLIGCFALALACSSRDASASDMATATEEPAEGGVIGGVPEDTAPNAAALLEYKRRHLSRAKLNYVSGTTGTTLAQSWIVAQGNVTPLSATDFSEMVGDERMVVRLKEQRQTAGVMSLAVGLASTGLIIGGIVMLDKSNEAMAAHYDLDLEDPGYHSTRDEADAYMAKGMALLLPGTIVINFSWMIPIFTIPKQRMPANYYTPDEAQAIIDRYNAELREELGLTQEDVLLIDMYGKRPQVEMTPVFGAGYFGIAGRF